MKIRGTIEFQDIEMGVWTLKAEDGETYQLMGGDKALKARGRRVEVEGDIQRNAVTVAMVGPVLQVKSYRFV